MKWSSILAIAAALLANSATQSVAQQPIPPGQTPIAQSKALRDRADANFRALAEAAKKCDVAQYRKLVDELYSLLQESNRLLEANRTATPETNADLYYDNNQIRFQFNNGQAELHTLEAVCAKDATPPGGDIGTVGSITPATEPEQFRMPAEKEDPFASLEYLHRWAHVAYNFHSLAAARCDLAEMRSQRSKLETFARAAEQFASKARRRGARNPARRQEADQANAYADAIKALWKAALAQQPMNCATAPEEKIQVPSPPTTPVKEGDSKDCPVPGTPGGTAPGSTPPGHGMRFTVPDMNAERMLAAHNRARAEVGVPPLIWDRELAVGAAEYAAQMSSVGRVHAPRAGRECVRENLLQSLKGDRSPEQMVGVWVAEKAYFKPGIFPDVSTTGDWSKVGHYSQVIWATTTHVGCATRSDARYDWTVCRYTPPGNRDGKNVLEMPAITKQPIPNQPAPIPYPPSPRPESPTG